MHISSPPNAKAVKQNDDVSVINLADQKIAEYRAQFPAIANNPDIAYLDNAATTQVPLAVLNAVQEYHINHSANPGRGSYDWAEDAEELVTQTRDKLKDLVDLQRQEGDIIFTSGTTMSLNMVAQGFAKQHLNASDEILLCLNDHHSMVLPWEELAKEKNLTLRPYRLRANGSIDLDDLTSKITERTKICCVTHINNTAGWINDLTAIRKALPDSIFLNVDAAQSISHASINMVDQGIDFLSFSGHKMFALGGIGALAISKRIATTMSDSFTPVFHGGSMAEFQDGDPIHKLMEAGTLNMAGIVSLNAACDLLQASAKDKHTHLSKMSQHLYQRLLSNPRINMIFEQKPYALDHLSGIASFTLDDIESGELSDILAERGIYIRAGRHCAGGSANESVRISLQAYNTLEEIDRICDLIDEIGGQV